MPLVEVGLGAGVDAQRVRLRDDPEAVVAIDLGLLALDLTNLAQVERTSEQQALIFLYIPGERAVASNSKEALRRAVEGALFEGPAAKGDRIVGADGRHICADSCIEACCGRLRQRGSGRRDCAHPEDILALLCCVIAFLLIIFKAKVEAFCFRASL